MLKLEHIQLGNQKTWSKIAKLEHPTQIHRHLQVKIIFSEGKVYTLSTTPKNWWRVHASFVVATEKGYS